MAKYAEIFVSGKTKWFRPDVPNEWGKWNHVIYLDDASVNKMRDLQAEGVKNVMKKDEEGLYMTFSRSTEMTRLGKKEGLKPPIVVDQNNEPINVRVGNGSDVTTKLEVYSHRVPGSTKMAKAVRWKASRIDNLVPFEGKKDFMEDEAKAVEGLAEQPKPVF